MPFISNLKINNDLISFDLDNSSNEIRISFVNAIRRTIISDIYTYAIDEKSVNFFENSSMLNNEFLKHRLTLIPVVSDLELSDINYENIVISCKKNNDGENMESIYVKDFICKDITTEKIIDNDKLFGGEPQKEYKYENILLCKIKNKQQLSFDAKLVKNNAEHGGSVFSPVSKCIYTFKIDDKEVKKMTSNMNETEKTAFNTLDIERVYAKNDKGEPNVYQFCIESIGFYKPKNIVLLGIESLINRLNNLKTDFNNKKSKKVELVENDINPDFFDFLIDNENETIGNLLSTYITYDENVFFCGYVIEHPLKKNIVLRIKLNVNNNLENIISLIDKNIDNITGLLNNIMNELKNI